MESVTATPPLSRTINLLAVIDTQYIKHSYEPNPDVLHPTAIKPDHLFLIGAGLCSNSGKLKFEAKTGDAISLTGTSATHNSNDAVILYNAHPSGRSHIFHPFRQKFVTRRCSVEPNPDSENYDGLPAIETTSHFSHLNSRIQDYGTQHIDFKFALYTLSDDGQTQRLYGYYRCRLSATVEPPHRTHLE
ncbi:AidA/PixA family protein [Paraburkholderia antibiotica]|uniref:DNA-directed RNA polymerase subunit beta n=1 Tax=Paraburkholderia antibiotica TaxID=2728839 RepID=A0A7Y0A2C0_9BURK|nr:AidA/PixA family protein [Paraburkholderia antibiotica]NML35198.1 DNA-directed RNA polymerase subunit beta [Paraburkholderia antibiotica]